MSEQPVVFTENAVSEISSNFRNLNSRIEHRPQEGGGGRLYSGKQVRIAKTVANNFSYPTGPTHKYEIILGEPEFDETVITDEIPDFTDYVGDPYRVACSLTKLNLKEGSLIHVELCHGRWYIVDKGISHTMRFFTNEKIVDRVVEVTVDWIETDLINPTTSLPYASGDVVDIHDPGNQFSDIEDGATGVAYYRTSEERWEIESCSLPINEVRAKITGCLLKTDPDGTATLNDDPVDWVRSTYPNVDQPPEFSGTTTLTFTFTNPWQLDSGLDAYGVFRRITNAKVSDPENTTSPKVRSSTSVAWELVRVEEQRARNILVTRGAGSSWTVDDFWDGADPEACGAPTFECVFDCNCIKEGQQAKGTYDPEDNVYRLESSASAMLGDPVDKTVIIGDDFAFNGCSLDYQTIVIKTFVCPTTDPTELSTAMQTSSFPVVTNVYKSTDGIYGSYGTVEVCGGHFGSSALLLPFYVCPPPATCSGTATWEWSHADQRWYETTPCASGCTSSPPADPAQVDKDDPAFDGAPTANTQACTAIVGT